MADFCVAPGATYLWWRAPAWTGKSALMSWFVLHPPPSVRVVSFFVTARLPGQSDRRAFCDNVLDQLCTILAEPIPSFLTDATRDGEVLGKLADAAARCAAAGEQLVLVVDGLDEDHSADGYSIAALLPVDLPSGLRVIVAARPDPPVPADVAEHHPLRTLGVVRELAPSPAARAIRVEMERDLKQLVRSEADILGLLVASGGGLSAADLAELTERLPWQIEDRLRSVAGRSFALRRASWRPDTEVYLLGHEELTATAITLLGPARLAGYRDRLHSWADGYREARWPQNTPEYLLLGYFRILDGDLTRMIACATDHARHEQIRRQSGGYLAAVTEIMAVQSILVTHDQPDLHTMARLAVRHSLLTEHNTNIPEELPEVWARLGYFERAENLALAIEHPQSQPLVVLARIAAEAGQVTRAQAIVSFLLASGRRWWADPLLGIPPWVGEHGATLLVSRDFLTSPKALPAFVRSEIAAGNPGFALGLARTEVDHVRRKADVWNTAEALGDLAAVVSGADREWAIELAQEAVTAADAIPLAEIKATAMVAVITAAKAIGDPAWVDRLISQTEAVARSIEDYVDQSGAFKELVSVIDDPDRAAEISGSILLFLHRNLATVSRAGVLFEHRGIKAAEALIRSLDNPLWQSKAWTSLVSRTSAGSSDYSRCAKASEAAARAVDDVKERRSALTALAVAATIAGDADTALRLATEVESVETSSVVLPSRVELTAELAKAIAALGDQPLAASLAAEAEDLAVRTRDWESAGLVARDKALHSVVTALLATGSPERAKAITKMISSEDLRDHARWLLRTDADDVESAPWSMSSIKKAAAAGDIDRAEALARSATEPTDRIGGLIVLARCVGSEQASRYADEAFALIGELDHPNGQRILLIDLLAALRDDPVRWRQAEAELERLFAQQPDSVYDKMSRVEALVVTDQLERAEALALSYADRTAEVDTWVQVSIWKDLATGTDLARTGRPIARLFQLDHWPDALTALTQEYPEVIRTIVDEFRASQNR